MASKDNSSEEDLAEMAPYISDTRQYSEFIMYFVGNGRFQHNSLLDADRRKGVLNLLQAERVIKLTRERRLSPVNIAMTPGGPRQRVYLIAITRAGNLTLTSVCFSPLTKPLTNKIVHGLVNGELTHRQ